MGPRKRRKRMIAAAVAAVIVPIQKKRRNQRKRPLPKRIPHHLHPRTLLRMRKRINQNPSQNRSRKSEKQTMLNSATETKTNTLRWNPSKYWCRVYLGPQQRKRSMNSSRTVKAVPAPWNFHWAMTEELAD